MIVMKGHYFLIEQYAKLGKTLKIIKCQKNKECQEDKDIENSVRFRKIGNTGNRIGKKKLQNFQPEGGKATLKQQQIQREM